MVNCGQKTALIRRLKTFHIFEIYFWPDQLSLRICRGLVRRPVMSATLSLNFMMVVLSVPFDLC
jgi:hypothetical protein